MEFDQQAFKQTRQNSVRHLLDLRNENGWWTGHLSSSALSTATAVTALTTIDKNNGQDEQQARIDAGIDWLVANQNEDGGWGDTDKSFSNISTTTLVWAAFGASGRTDHACMTNCENWLKRHAGSLDPDALSQAIMQRYGKDRTFSVPILTMTAISGRFGDVNAPKTWQLIRQLPFELAAFPRCFFRFLNLQVVSYALPALIAIGQARHVHRPTGNPFARWLRKITRSRTLSLLQKIQPSSGGFLEAAPLTSFVAMSLACSGQTEHQVTKQAIQFLTDTVRSDGSWPIDTNLATWVTTLSVNALAAGAQLGHYLDQDERAAIRDWLLSQQYSQAHPYTGAAPGGWAWTDLPGGVPDADDTSGAMIALWNFHQCPDASEESNQAIRDAAQRGMAWLSSVQNGNGGIPTFCKGWGRLPFDRSSSDITAHFVRAHRVWTSTGLNKSDPQAAGASVFLRESQNSDDSWSPLWFGNQYCHDEINFTYGTSRVMLAYPIIKSRMWLECQQNDDGGWGGGSGAPSSIEETALAVEALAAVKPADDKLREVIIRGVSWLMKHTAQGEEFEPAPIGFYFAKLWYYEKLYPVIFTVAALESAASVIEIEDVASDS